MIDNTAPISNFHRYEAPEAVPHSEEPERGLPGVLEKVGVEPERYRNFRARVKSMNGRDWLARLGALARSPTALLITGIAIAVIGVTLTRRRVLH
jgi:hypothetical protein